MPHAGQEALALAVKAYVVEIMVAVRMFIAILLLGWRRSFAPLTRTRASQCEANYFKV
jgi:hypothetical protein